MDLLVGAHLDNVDQPPEASFARLRAMRAAVVGTLWTDGTRHRRPVYDRLERDLGGPVYVVRVGPSRVCTPLEWLNQADAALLELPPAALGAGRVRVRALNEVNLPAEGGWRPEQYAAFLAAVRAHWGGRAPLCCAPVSLGDPGWPGWWAAFVAACGGAIPADRLAVNCYADLVGQAARFTGHGRPVDVTELNTLALPPGPARAAWFLDACRRLAAAGVESAQAFIVGGVSHGAWDGRYALADDEARVIGQRPPFPVARPQPTPEEVPMDTNPWRGKVAVVHQLWTLDVDALVAALRRLGFAGVDVKVADGDSSYVARVAAGVRRLQAAGFAVTGWAYNYCDLVQGDAAAAADRGQGIPELEAAAAVDAAERLGLAGLTFDLEAECEGHGDLVAILLARAREATKVPLAAFTWAARAGHERYPWDTICAAVDVLRPMCYAPAFGAETMFRQLAGYFAGRRVAPVWSVTEATAAQLAAQLATGAPAGVAPPEGEGYWEAASLVARADELAPLVADRFAALAATDPAAPPAPPAVSADDLEREVWGPAWRAKDAAYAAGRSELGKAIEKAVVKDKIAAGVQAA